jgi:hypothetical protein
MPLPFDATLKDLASEHPRALLAAFDAPSSDPVRLLNIDLSTVTTATDVVIGVGDPLRDIVHFDFQASASATKHADVLVYNALLHRQYRVPVHSIVVLLRPKAAHANLDGTVAYTARPGRGKMDFGYEVIRLWDIPAEQLLAGDLGLLPLAPLGKLPDDVAVTDGLASVIQRLIERLEREAPLDQARRLLTAAYVLTGLRIPDKAAARQLFQGVRAMRESVTYMAILDEGRDEGRIDEAKKIILRLGRELFGPPDEATAATLAAIEDLERLEFLSDQLLKVKSWQELLAR